MRMRFSVHTGSTANQDRTDRDIVAANVLSIEVRKNQLAIRLKSPDAEGASDCAQEPDRNPLRSNDGASNSLLLIPWCKPPSRKSREILLPPTVSRHTVRPIKAERRTALLRSIARGRDWLDEIVSGAALTVEQIAGRHKCSVRHVNMTISMSFIAPALVKAAVEGRLPRGVGVAALRDAPAEWSRQFERLGLTQS
jgi:site-specific DNA recombinase